MFQARWAYDGSAHGGKKVAFGNTWVIAAIVVRLPFCPSPVAPPLLTTGTTRRNPPEPPIFPLRIPDPASRHPALPHRRPDPRYPGLQATPRRLMHQSRNVSARPAPLMTHRYIYFAGTLAPDFAYRHVKVPGITAGQGQALGEYYARQAAKYADLTSAS